MKRYTKKHARRSLFHTAAFRGISQLATFASFAVLVRSMSEHEFGVLQLLYAVIPVVSTVASLGIEQTLRRYQPEYLQSGQGGAAAWLVWVAASMRFVTNILVLSAIFLLWNWIAPFFQLAPYRTEFALFCLLILLHFQASILQLSLSSHMLQAYSVGMTVILSVTKLLVYVALAWFDSLTLTHAIFADMTAYGLMYLGLRIAHSKHCIPPPGERKFHIEPLERRRLLRYGLFNNFNDAGTLLLTSKSDTFFIAALMNPAAAGAYAFYVRLSEMAGQLLPIRQFSNVIQPLFFAVSRAQAAERLPRYMTFLLNTTFALQLPIAAYTTAYHEDIVRVLFGGKFAESSWLLPIVVWFATLNRVSDPVTLVAQYQEKAAVILLSKIFVVYNVVALLIFVPLWGLYGAAFATGSAQLMKNLFIWWHVRDTARWLNFRVVLTTSLLIWGGIIALCYLFKQALSAPAVVDLLCGALLCGLATLLFMRSPAISAADRQLLASLFHGRESRVLGWLGVLPKSPSGDR